MNTALLASAVVLVGIGSWVMTCLLRTNRALGGRIDVPNERSLHTTPTPRGGGTAIVLATTAFVAWLAISGEIEARRALGLGLGGLVVASLGWLDDRSTLGNWSRILVWFPVAAFGVWSVGGLPTIDLGRVTLDLGISGSVLATIGVVWAINSFNFMDGIDGLAGGTAVIVAFAAALLLVGGPWGWVCAAIGAAALGFLAHNWPPARIFMGDVGSGWFGYIFALLALGSEADGTMPLASWGILLAVFIVDTTLTLVRRIWRGERWHEAHRTHAYQLAVQRGHSHQTVTLAFLAIELILVIFAALAMRAPWRLPTLVAIILLLTMAWRSSTREIPWRRQAKADGLRHP